jgi:hypothetical protein
LERPRLDSLGEEDEEDEARLVVVLDGLGVASCDGAMARPTMAFTVVGSSSLFVLQMKKEKGEEEKTWGRRKLAWSREDKERGGQVELGAVVVVVEDQGAGGEKRARHVRALSRYLVRTRMYSLFCMIWIFVCIFVS